MNSEDFIGWYKAVKYNQVMNTMYPDCGKLEESEAIKRLVKESRRALGKIIDNAIKVLPLLLRKEG